MIATRRWTAIAALAPLLLGCVSTRTSVLEGAYLGQRPPGPVPELFAPGIVSTGKDELNAVFSADGAEFFFAVKVPIRGRHVLLTMRQRGGRWTAPAVLPFSGEYDDADPALSPDGRTLYFASTRPLSPGGPAKDWDIWAVDRQGEGWGAPRRLDPPVNSGAMEVYPSLTANGTLYFSSGRPFGARAGGIFRAVSSGGRFPTVEVFDSAIVSRFGGGDVFIAPDERTIIFSASDSAGFGSSDLYVSFRREDGSWTEPRNLGAAVNSRFQEYCPSLSPDGRYLFFSSYKPPSREPAPAIRSVADIERAYREPHFGAGDVYWVDAAILEAVRDRPPR